MAPSSNIPGFSSIVSSYSKLLLNEAQKNPLHANKNRKKPLLEHKKQKNDTETKETLAKLLNARKSHPKYFLRRQWDILRNPLSIPRNIHPARDAYPPVLAQNLKILQAPKNQIDQIEASKAHPEILQKLNEAESNLNLEEKKAGQAGLPPLETPINPSRKEQSRFAKFIIKHFNNPEKAKRKAYKSEIKKTLENFDTLPAERKRQLQAFQYYYNIKPKKKKRSSLQSWNKKFKSVLTYLEQLSTLIKNLATIGQRIAVPSSMHAAVQASAQTTASVASAAVEATGIGLGAAFIPIQIFDALRSIKKAVRSKENYDYANLYIKEKAADPHKKPSETEKELLASARYLRNKQNYWNKRLNAVDAVQGLVSTGLSTACALAAAIAAPIFPVLTPIMGGIGLGIITGSLGTTVGLSTFKGSKGLYKWSKAKAAKKAYENPEGILAKRAKRQAFREYKIENGMVGKNIKLKNLSPAARALVENEINTRAKELLKQSHIQYSGKFAAKTLYERLCSEQIQYHNDKSPAANLVEGPVAGFLKHFNVEENVIKAILDCPDEKTAQKLLRNEMKKGIRHLNRKDIDKALQDAKAKRQQAVSP